MSLTVCFPPAGAKRKTEKNVSGDDLKILYNFLFFITAELKVSEAELMDRLIHNTHIKTSMFSPGCGCESVMPVK